MHPDFSRLAEAAAQHCEQQFGHQCIAQYLHGSVYRGDAVPGVSDLDHMFILTSAPTPAELELLHQMEHTLLAHYPVAAEVHLTPMPLDDLRHNAFARFALRYNACLRHGQDVLSLLEAEGIPTPVPDASFSKKRLDFARMCFQQALDGETPANTGPLPAHPCYVCRKYARYFVVIEGAYFLMVCGMFTSFEQQDVLARLFAACPDHRAALILTRSLLDAPETFPLSPADYLNAITPLVRWMFDQIDLA